MLRVKISTYLIISFFVYSTLIFNGYRSQKSSYSQRLNFFLQLRFFKSSYFCQLRFFESSYRLCFSIQCGFFRNLANAMPTKYTAQ